MFKTALVTGGNGNLGRLVAQNLEAIGTRVVSFDLSGSEGPHYDPRHAVVLGDMRDQSLLEDTLTTHKPDVVIHLASMLSGSSEVNPELAWDVNASSSIRLMRQCLDRNIGPFFFASTAATYGPDLASPVALDTPQWPENIYGATKVAVERMGVYLKLKQGFDFRCLRFPMVLSPSAPAGAMTAYPSHAIAAAARGDTFVMPVAPDTGMSTLYLNDVTRSIVEICSAERAALTQHAYNLHSFMFTAQDLVEAIQSRFPGFSCTFTSGSPTDDLILRWPDVFDDSAARADWGWAPHYDFDATIEALVQFANAQR
ncbi:NAD-dependent epimerase/dehydratase family protein [uncultured Planktomarina sp.]|uniref:NAD-dependent epimerase/dehydratase family protein n=1 Tax=uncultured Planktomarina sp. TaxID=1538529 RepID=UPI003260FA5C